MRGRKLVSAAAAFLMLAGCGKTDDEQPAFGAAGEAATPIFTEVAVTDTDSAFSADSEDAVTETESSSDETEDPIKRSDGTVTVTDGSSSETESASDDPVTDSAESTAETSEPEDATASESFEGSYTARFAEQILAGEFDAEKKIRFPDGYIGEERLAMYGGDICYTNYSAHPADQKREAAFEQQYLHSEGVNRLIDKQGGYYIEKPLSELKLADEDILAFFGLTAVFEGGMTMTSDTDEQGRVTERFVPKDEAAEGSRLVLTYDTDTGLLVSAERNLVSNGGDHITVTEYGISHDGKIEVIGTSLPEYGSGKFVFRDRMDLMWDIQP